MSEYKCAICGVDFDSQRALSVHESKGHDEPYKDKEVLKQLYVDDRMSARDVAKKFDVHMSTILRWLENHGIERHDRNKLQQESMWEKPPSMRTNNRGYECVRTTVNNEIKFVYVHRLCALAWYGWENVVDKDVHHKKEIPWLNMEGEIEPLSHSEHRSIHTQKAWDEGFGVGAQSND